VKHQSFAGGSHLWGSYADDVDIYDVVLGAGAYGATATGVPSPKYISAAERTELTLKDLGIALPSELKKVIVKEFEEVVLDDPPPLVEGALILLKSLHEQYRIGLICDSGMTPGRILKRILEHHNVLKYFCCTIFSDEIGYTKPNPEIFKKALEKLDAESIEVIHVGDLLRTDIAGAKAVYAFIIMSKRFIPFTY